MMFQAGNRFHNNHSTKLKKQESDHPIPVFLCLEFSLFYVE